MSTREMLDKDNRYIPKEIAVTALDGPFTAHWIIAPPHSYAKLPPSIRRENNADSLFYHKIEWHEGDVTCDQAYANLRRISQCSRNIFVQRVETFLILLEIIERKKIIRLYKEEVAEGLSHLSTTRDKCIWHSLPPRTTTTECALNEVISVKKWIKIFYPSVENKINVGLSFDGEKLIGKLDNM